MRTHFNVRSASSIHQCRLTPSIACEERPGAKSNGTERRGSNIYAGACGRLDVIFHTTVEWLGWKGIVAGRLGYAFEFSSGALY
jgi:hypothetical protein